MSVTQLYGNSRLFISQLVCLVHLRTLSFGQRIFLNEKEKSLHKLEFTIRKFIQKKKKLKRHKVLATELVAPIFFSINVQFMGFTKTIILNTNEMD